MCNHCPNDPRDALDEGVDALEGLRDLLCEATGRGKRQYEGVSPSGLYALVRMVEERLQFARRGMADYAPRGWKPPQA